MPWDNPALDGLIWVLAIAALTWWLLCREARRVERDPLAEPISHVRTVAHAPACWTSRGLECCCDEETAA